MTLFRAGSPAHSPERRWTQWLEVSLDGETVAAGSARCTGRLGTRALARHLRLVCGERRPLPLALPGRLEG